jgi:hypothetical protein
LRARKWNLRSPKLKDSELGTSDELSRIIEDSDKPAETPERKDEPVTIVQAVTEYLADAKARELADATLYKLEIQLRKQFLTYARQKATSYLKGLISGQTREKVHVLHRNGA